MTELRIYKITDAGPKENQDSCYVIQYEDVGALACIADGVSSQKEARKTSVFITDYVEDWYAEEGGTIFRSQPEEVKDMMTNLVLDIHSDLLIGAKSGKKSMGSTIDLAVMGKGRLFITHVGDSRVYLYDGEKIQKLTEDQTVSEAEKTTGIKFRDVEEKRKAHTLMQCVGSGKLEPYTYDVNIPTNCDILLCTDGLTNTLTEQELAEELKRKQRGTESLQNLVRTARNRGESDNITAILIRRREKPENRKAQNPFGALRRR